GSTAIDGYDGAGDSTTAGSGGAQATGGTGVAGAPCPVSYGCFGGTVGAPIDAGAVTSDCPTGLPGPPLIAVPPPSGGRFCIDATEVTNAQYAAFLATNPQTSLQPARCTSWNGTYAGAYVGPLTGRDDYPVVGVTWCDAFAYCKWAGKRLCG